MNSSFHLARTPSKNGHCVVPQHYSRNRALGKWVAKQREQYRFYREGRHSFLPQERIDLLKSIGFTWQIKGRGLHKLKKRENDSGTNSVDEDDMKMGISIQERGGSTKDGDADADDASEIGMKVEMGMNVAPPLPMGDGLKMDYNDGFGSSMGGMSNMPASMSMMNHFNTMQGMNGLNSMNMPGMHLPKMPERSLTEPGSSMASMMDHKASALSSGMEMAAHQQVLLAERQQLHQHAASMAAIAAHANQQRDLQMNNASGVGAPGGGMANNQTMADIAAALASVPRFGDSFSSASGMRRHGNNPAASYQHKMDAEDPRMFSGML